MFFYFRWTFTQWLLFYLGFKITSLNKIIDTKASNDSKITLLHYLLELLEKKVGNLLNLLCISPCALLLCIPGMTILLNTYLLS